MLTKSKIKAFFFDFDGVLCNTEHLHMQALRLTLKNHNIQFSDDYYYNTLCGVADEELFEHFFSEHKLNLTTKILTSLLTTKNIHFIKLMRSSNIVIKKAKELVMSLHDKGIRLSVVSGSLLAEVKLGLEICELSEYFDFLVTKDHVTKTKPDPACYELAFNKMKKIIPGLNKSDIMVLEDSPTGVNAAKSAGLYVVAITNSTTPNKLEKADKIISHYEFILKT